MCLRTVLEDLSRRISVMKSMLQTSKGRVFDQLEIEVKFNSILPENLTENTDMLDVAVQSGLTSKINGISNLSYNENPAAVYDDIVREAANEVDGVAVNA